MAVLMVPELDSKRWPTLGPLVCQWIERNLVFGPGDKRGEPAVIDDEKRALIYRMYEVFPQSDTRRGRRRFKRVGLSLRKGSAKTELLAWIASAELHPKAPVRCAGFEKDGRLIGCGVKDPYIPLVAYTEEQSDELAFGAMRAILEMSKVAKDFDIGLERILRRGGDGKAASLASSPGARDGARTTFQGFDETHRMTLEKLRKAHRTMLANMAKRKLSDPWALETTTAYQPGEQSVAETTMDYARAVAEGRKADARLFFFHRWAGDDIEIYLPDGSPNKTELRRAVEESSGGLLPWTDVDSITEQWNDPTEDRTDLERLWLNRIKKGSARAFNLSAWGENVSAYVPADGTRITLGFDGSRYNDSTALIATEIETGFQWAIGLWERPFQDRDAHAKQEWEVPEAEAEEAVRYAFETFTVVKFYGDPPNWDTHMSKWSATYGDEVVIRYRTNQWKKMAASCKAYSDAIVGGEVTHGDGAKDDAAARERHKGFTRHLGNAHKIMLRSYDSDRNLEWVIGKERKDSSNKMDAAVAAVLSWQARIDGLAIPEPEPAGDWTGEVVMLA